MSRRTRTNLDGTMLGARVSAGRSMIRSIQRGTITIGNGQTSNTATITAVDLANTRLVFLGLLCTETATQYSSTYAHVELTNTTTVTATRGASDTDTVTVSFEVVEYWPGVIKSIQRNTITVSGVTSATATVTAVVVAKASLEYLGWLAVDTSEPNRALAHLALTNATTVTATKNTSTNGSIHGFQLVEYF